MKEIKVKCLSCGSLEGGDFCGSCHTVLPIEHEDIDFFELFGLAPRPYLDQEALKGAFFNLSQKLHPDHNMEVSGDTRLRVLTISAHLNRGYTTLSNTKERLRYLVGQQTNAEPQEAKQVPAEMMELFFEVHDLMQEVDAYLKNKKAPASRIEAALAMADDGKRKLLEQVAALRSRATDTVNRVETEIKALDGQWDAADDREPLLARLNLLADVLAYLGRLHTSLDEKELALQI